MRIFIPIVISFFIISCSQQAEKEGDLVVQNLNDSAEIIEGPVLVKAANYRFYIPGIFTHKFKEDIDVKVAENFLSVDDGLLQAKKYWYMEKELTAISFKYISPDQAIMRSASHLITRNEDGDIVDIMDVVFPEMDVYAFYDFGDQALKQFEGDEQTVFAGYELDFSKEDSLGVQFTFCNKKDEANSDFLNENGVVRYISLEEL